MRRTLGLDMVKDVAFLLLKMLMAGSCLLAANLFVFFLSQKFLGESGFLLLLINLVAALGCLYILVILMGKLGSELQTIEKKHRPWLFDKFGNRL